MNDESSEYGRGSQDAKLKIPLHDNSQSNTKECSENSILIDGVDKKASANKRYWFQLWNEKPDRHIELGLTLAISFFALVQLIVSCNNNKSTSQQTDQLIAAAKISAYAADQNATAAQNFAYSARNISSGVDSAVGKLNLQAAALRQAVNQSSRLAAATEKANANVAIANRPWIGATISVNSFRVGERASFTLLFNNSGKTPAVVEGTNGRLGATDHFPNDPESEYPEKSGKRRGFMVPGGVIASRQTGPAPLEQSDFDALSMGKITYFVFGKIEYRDTVTTNWYWTHVCLVYKPELVTVSDNGFRNCTSYNNAQ